MLPEKNIHQKSGASTWVNCLERFDARLLTKISKKIIFYSHGSKI